MVSEFFKGVTTARTMNTMQILFPDLDVDPSRLHVLNSQVSIESFLLYLVRVLFEAPRTEAKCFGFAAAEDAFLAILKRKTDLMNAQEIERRKKKYRGFLNSEVFFKFWSLLKLTFSNFSPFSSLSC